MVAVALALHILVTSYSCWRQMPRVKPLLIPATLLVGLVMLQLALGAATWIVKYGPPSFMTSSDFAATFTVQEQSWWQAQITTAHVATGSLIFAIATVLALFSRRLLTVEPRMQSAMKRSARPAVRPLSEVAA